MIEYGNNSVLPWIMEEICIIVSCDIYTIRYKLTEDFKGNDLTARTYG